MTPRENQQSLVDILDYQYFWPDTDSEDAVYGFTHSNEVLNLCAAMIPPHVVTPVEKTELETTLGHYMQRRNIPSEDAAKIRSWMNRMPDEVAIIEREP